MPLANFYTRRGWMVGVDFHEYNFFVPGVPLPATVPLWPHFTGAPFYWASNSQYAKTVTNHTAEMVVENFDVYLVPHLPLVLPFAIPGPLEPVIWALVEALSGTEVIFGQASVTAGGDETSTALYGLMGVNVNCSDPIDALLDVTFNPNTVQTMMTLGNILSSLVGYALSAGFGFMLGKALKSHMKKVFAKAASEMVEEAVEEAAETALAFGEKQLGKGAAVLLQGATSRLEKRFGEDVGKMLAEGIPEAIAKHVVRITPLLPWGADELNFLFNPFDATGTTQGAAKESAEAAFKAMGVE